MNKRLFSNLDFSNNAALNLVIGSLQSDPSYGQTPGYTYYNTTRKCLRVYNDNKWEDVISIGNGLIMSVVDTLPNTGEKNVIYLIPRYRDENDTAVTYNAYRWDSSSNTYGQISGYSIPVSWNDLTDKPDLLNCYISDGNEANDKTLVLTYS